MAVVCAFLLVKRMTLPMDWQYCNKIRLIQSTMKKLNYLSLMLLCAAISLSFSACSDDEEVVNDTTYTFMYYDVEQPEVFEIDVTLFEYNDKEERIAQNSIEDIEDGFSKQFVANKNAQKVKVYLTTRYNSSSVYNWVQQVYYLEPGKDTKIEVTGTSIVGTSEP